MTALEDIGTAVQRVANYRPRRTLVRRLLNRSAVGLFLSDHLDRDLSVLMIKRAERIGDPWSGHMAFPGGRKDRDDRNTLATARRETIEEIGFDAQLHARLAGRLSDVATFGRLRVRPMVITPYVFRVNTLPRLVPNKEVDEVVWVPLAYLADPGNRQKMLWRPKGVPIELPCYLYREYRIWGLSLMMLDELLAVLR